MSLKHTFSNVRFLVTRHCPFHCPYCHNEGMGKGRDSTNRLNLSDYLYLSMILHRFFQTQTVILSGGDPFVFAQLPQLGRQLREMGLQVKALSKGMPVYQRIVKNHLRGDEFDWVYFSLDTLDPKKFATISGIQAHALQEGILALKQMIAWGVLVRINAVVSPETSVQEIMELIDFAKEQGVEEVKFIERMNTNTVTKPYLEAILAKAGVAVSVKNDPHYMKRTYTTTGRGQKIKLVRGTCAVTSYSSRTICIVKDIFIDPEGHVNTCIEWKVHRNPYVVSILQAVKERNTQELVAQLDSVPIKIMSCPIVLRNREKA